MSITRAANSYTVAANPYQADGWQEWRKNLLTAALWCTLVCGGIAFWGTMLVSAAIGTNTDLLIMLICYLWLFLAAVNYKLPYPLRAASLLLTTLAAGIGLMFFSAMPSIGLILVLSAIVLSFLLAGWQTGITAAFLGIGGLTVVLSSALPLSGINFIGFEAAGLYAFLVTASLTLSAAAPAIMTLVLYSAGTTKGFKSWYELIQRSDQQKAQFQHTIRQITHDFDTHLLYENTYINTIRLFDTTRTQAQFLKRFINLIVNSFDCQRAEVYLTVDGSTYTHILQYIDENGVRVQDSELISIDDAPAAVRQALTREKPEQIYVDWKMPGNADIGTGNCAIAWIPVASGAQTIGFLSISKHPGVAFSEAEITALKTNAQLLGLGVLNLQLSMSGQIQPGNTSAANQAINLLTRANTQDEILSIVSNSLKISTFPSIQLTTEAEVLNLVAVTDPENAQEAQTRTIKLPIDRIERLVINNPFAPMDIDNQPGMPDDLISFQRELGWACSAYIPVHLNGRLIALHIIGSRNPDQLTPFSIQPYASLAGYASTTLEKVTATGKLQRRVAALQSLSMIGQAISAVTELEQLFGTVHEQVSLVIGEVDLAVALYDAATDMISIPYAHEAGETIRVEPFPLGQGLTSILIHSKQPLMIVNDTERKALDLGAKVSGASAKSWLGVPLVVSGDVLGAIILQDTSREQRFDDDDLRLMTTLASQVAITIRNVRLLLIAERRAEKEKIISNITSKIWAAPDIESVTRTALQELGRALHASSGQIQLDKPLADFPPRESPEHEAKVNLP
jgi:GAF domain-containing protein